MGGGLKYIVHKVCTKFLELHWNAFKPYPYCANLAANFTAKLISAFNKMEAPPTTTFYVSA